MCAWPNLLHFGPTTIAAIYKDRWEIELFFKALKQNLKVKSFVGIADKTQTNTLTPWPALACEKPWLGWFSDLAEMIRQYDRLQFLALATCQAGCRLATDISPRFALVFRESYPAGLQSSSKRDHKASLN